MKHIEIEIRHVIEYPLEKKMKEKGMTIRSLGEKSGVHYTYISRLLNHKSRCTTIIADKIMEALGENTNPTN